MSAPVSREEFDARRAAGAAPPAPGLVSPEEFASRRQMAAQLGADTTLWHEFGQQARRLFVDPIREAAGYEPTAEPQPHPPEGFAESLTDPTTLAKVPAQVVGTGLKLLQGVAAGGALHEADVAEAYGGARTEGLAETVRRQTAPLATRGAEGVGEAGMDVAGGAALGLVGRGVRAGVRAVAPAVKRGVRGVGEAVARGVERVRPASAARPGAKPAPPPRATTAVSPSHIRSEPSARPFREGDYVLIPSRSGGRGTLALVSADETPGGRVSIDLGYRDASGSELMDAASLGGVARGRFPAQPAGKASRLASERGMVAAAKPQPPPLPTKPAPPPLPGQRSPLAAVSGPDPALVAAKQEFASKISVGERQTTRPTVREMVDNVVDNWIDDSAPLARADKSIGRAPTADKAAWSLAQRARGAVGKADQIIDDEVKPLLEKVGTERLPDFRQYLVAERVLERPELDLGFTREGAEALVRAHRAEFEPVAQRLWTLGQRLIEMKREVGLLSDEAADQILAKNQRRVGFYRVMGPGTPAGGGKGAGYAKTSSGVQRLKGSERQVIDPLENMIRDVYETVRRVEEQRVWNAIADAGIAERIPPPVRPVRMSAEDAIGKLEELGYDVRSAKPGVLTRDPAGRATEWRASAQEGAGRAAGEAARAKRAVGEAQAAVKDAQRILAAARKGTHRTTREGGRRAAEEAAKRLSAARQSERDARRRAAQALAAAGKMRPGRDILSETAARIGEPLDHAALEVLTAFEPLQIPTRKNIQALEFPALHKGERGWFRLRDADIFDAVRGLTRPEMDIWTKIGGLPARLRRAGVTMYSPDFALRNPFRDAVQAANLTHGSFKRSAGALAVGAAVGGAVGGPVGAGVGMLAGPAGAIMAEGLFHALGKTALYRAWRMSGGANASLVGLDRAALQRTLKQIMASPRRKALNVVTSPKEAFAAMQRFSEVGEEVTRLSEFANVRRAGGSPAAAALSSRDLMDFPRMGSKSRLVNRFVSFFSANIRGTEKMAREVWTRPAKVLPRVFATITIPSLTLYAAQKDEPAYQALPRWQRDIFWCIVLRPGDPDSPVLRLPKPFELGVLFGTVPERIAEYVATRDPAAFEEFVRAIVEPFTPPIMPAGADTLLENVIGDEGYSFFRRRPIVPREVADRIPEERVGPFSGPVSKTIGGGLGVSPAKVDNAIRGFFGAPGTMAVQGIDAAAEALGADGGAPDRVDLSPTAAKVPGIRGFVARAPGFYSADVERLYRDSERPAQVLRTYQEVGKQKGPEWADRFYEDNKADVEAGLVLGPAVGRIQELARQRKLLDTAGLPEDEAKAWARDLDSEAARYAREVRESLRGQ